MRSWRLDRWHTLNRPRPRLPPQVTGIKLTVLIVDDTPENIDVLSAVLEGLGCELTVATNGPRALELAARRRPDLILLDVMMPGMDGFEVCRRLKADMALAEVPVIFVTARADDISTGFAVGGADYITKPINADEVLARVRHQIERQVLLADLRDANRAHRRTHARQPAAARRDQRAALHAGQAELPGYA